MDEARKPSTIPWSPRFGLDASPWINVQGDAPFPGGIVVSIAYRDPTSSRQMWTAKLPVSKIIDLVSKRSLYHEAKAEEWSDRYRAAEADLRENGIDFEVIARGASASSTYRSPEISYDLRKKLSDANDRLTYHRERLDEYDAYAILLREIVELDPSTRLYVQADDIEWLYLPSQHKRDKDEEAGEGLS